MNTDTGLFRRELVRFYDKSFDWVLSAGPKLVAAILVLVFGLWFIRLLRSRIGRAMDRRAVHSSLRPFFESLAFTALYVALFFLILQILGIKLTVFAAIIAAFGAAAGLALSGTLQNFASGILILLLKPFNVGDNIVAQGVEGTVTSIQIFYTIVTTFDNRSVIIPNSKLSNEVITNITQIGTRRLDITLTFKHNIPVERAKSILEATFHNLPEANNTPPPRIGIASIGKDEYSLISNVWVNAHGFEDSKLRINKAVLDALHKEGLYNS